MTARLRGVRPHLLLVVALGPILGIVATFLLDGWLPGLGIPALLLFVGGAYFAVHRFKPRRWPVAAAVLGGLAGAYVGSLWLPWVTAPLAVLAFGTAGHLLASRAGKKILCPYSADLADSAIEVPWPARGSRGLELLVGANRITLVGSRGRLRTVRPVVDLGSVGAVEQVMVARRATLHVPGVGELNVTVTPGPAVRIAVPPGEWILPTDQGRDLARLVARRKELAG
ncbi:hypothetical protein [Alloactinosynnema sp. L-07]|uniref:hypothetical protein n=1 Tax=Alloactinosynnema sp. L-07 TaxID=1653480 RepID=UPI0012F9FC9E|nr:hypothetical protein [Alloactinosynnema sp. L-07]